MANTTQSAARKSRARRANIILAIVGLLVLLVLLVLWLGPGRGLGPVLASLRAIDPVAYWVLLMAVMAGLFGLIGRATNKRWLGALIDSSTNSMSLSRLQVSLWTILVLSAYLMLAMPRIFGRLASFDDLKKSNDALLAQCLKDKATDFVPTIDGCSGGALQISFPSQLVLAMGISLASFAGSHLIQNAKGNQNLDLVDRDNKVTAAQTKLDLAQQAYNDQKDKSNKIGDDYGKAEDAVAAAQAKVQRPKPDENLDQLKQELSLAQRDLDQIKIIYQRSTNDLSQASTNVNDAKQALETVTKDVQVARTEAEGVLHKNDDINQASWIDMFRGNQITNYLQVDFGKVQMFFFTVVILLAYGAAVTVLLRSGPAMMNPLGIGFPPFSDSLNGLLAISHGTYLTTKATAQA